MEMSFGSRTPVVSSGLAVGSVIGGVVSEIDGAGIDFPHGPGIHVGPPPWVKTDETVDSESVQGRPTGRPRLGVAVVAPSAVEGSNAERSNAEAVTIVHDRSASPTLT